MKTYNFPDHVSGDTFKERGFRIYLDGAPLDLTGSSIKMELRRSAGSTPALTLSTTDNSIRLDGSKIERFYIPKQKLTAPAGVYMYDIQITLSNGDVFTYLSGTFPFLQDITQ